ncbi:MAG: DUF2723 domain-containing protein [Gemmatimonadota bacterium]
MDRPAPAPPYLEAALAGAAVLLLYALTLAPTTAFWDASEYIVAAHTLGVPHPPGSILFVLLGRAWDVALGWTGMSGGVRLNLFAATTSALAHACWFLVADRLLAEGSGGRAVRRAVRRAGAWAAVLLSATAFTVWSQSNVNEKVYTVALLTIALLTWLALRWRDTRSPKLLVLGVYLLVLSVANHLMAALVAPALLLFVLRVDARALLAPRTLGAMALAGATALSVYLALPLRAELDPVMNTGEATCASLTEAGMAVATRGHAGCPALGHMLTRAQYPPAPPLTGTRMDHDAPRDAGIMAAQLGNFAQYFDWQWARSVAGNDTLFGGLRPLVTLLFLGLGILGLHALGRRDGAGLVLVGVLMGTLSLGLVAYLNFRFGFSWPVPPEWQPLGNEAMEVRERDYFYMAAFSLWGVCAGLGVAEAWRRATAALGRRSRRPAWLAAPVLAVALLPLALNWGWASRAGDTAARDWAHDLLNSVPPYGVLVTNGDNDTFPLWYVQEVEGVRRDVQVVVLPYLSTPWYARQVRELTSPCPAGVDPLATPSVIVCQRPFEPDTAAEVWHTHPLAANPPGDSILPLTDEEIARAAAGAFYVQEPTPLRLGAIQTVVPGGTVIAPSDTFLVAMIRQSVASGRALRWSAPPVSTELFDLRAYMVREGLAFRLNDGPVIPDAALRPVPPNTLGSLTGTWINVPLSERLMQDFAALELPERTAVWPDAATRSILFQYGALHFALANAYAADGRQDAAEAHAVRTNAWLGVGLE